MRPLKITNPTSLQRKEFHIGKGFGRLWARLTVLSFFQTLTDVQQKTARNAGWKWLRRGKSNADRKNNHVSTGALVSTRRGSTGGTADIAADRSGERTALKLSAKRSCCRCALRFWYSSQRRR